MYSGIYGFSYYVARLAQSVEHETLNLRVVGSSPTLGAKTFGYNTDWTNIVKKIPTARLELAIFGLGDRRLIHWATRASLPSDHLFCSKNGNLRALCYKLYNYIAIESYRI